MTVEIILFGKDSILIPIKIYSFSEVQLILKDIVALEIKLFCVPVTGKSVKYHFTNL